MFSRVGLLLWVLATFTGDNLEEFYHSVPIFQLRYSVGFSILHIIECVLFIAVYMARHKHLCQDNKIFTTSLSQIDSHDPSATLVVEHSDQGSPIQLQTYGSGSLGCSYELCAGIIDKKVSKEQTAVEEVLEETG